MLNIPYIYRHARSSAEELILKVARLRNRAAVALNQNDNEFCWRSGDKEIQWFLDWPDRGPEDEGLFSFNEYLSMLEGDLERGSTGVFERAGCSAPTAFHLIKKLAYRTSLSFGFFHSQGKSMAALKRNRKVFAVHFENISPLSHDDVDAISSRLKLDARNAAKCNFPRLPGENEESNPTRYLSPGELDFVTQLLCSEHVDQLGNREIRWLQDFVERTTPEECIDGPEAHKRLRSIIALNAGELVERCYLGILLKKPRIVTRTGYDIEIDFERKSQAWELFTAILRARENGRKKDDLIQELGHAEKTENHVRNLVSKVNSLLEPLQVEIETGGGHWKLVEFGCAT